MTSNYRRPLYGNGFQEIMVASEIERLDQSDRMLQLDRLMASLSTIPMTANSFRLFSAKLRTLIIEDVTNVERSRCSIWDDFFAILFVYSFRFSSPSACWPRICRTLILQDALDPMSAKGVVRNLIDRYFGIFSCVQANEICSLDLFIQTWIDPSTNQQNTLGFDTSFLHALSIVPVGWGLLHHAAHSASQDMIVKLINYGAEVGIVDADKRHALHIAAASLNLDVTDYLSDNSRNSFIYDVDIYGKTPLDILLEASALSNWIDRVTPLRLFSSIIKLLGVSQNLWSYGGDHHIDDSKDKDKDDHTYKNKIISETATTSNTNKFYSILFNVRGCDDIVALKVIDVARSCSNYLWDVSIIMQIIILSVRQRRYQLLKSLLESFHEKLFTHFQYSSTHVTIGLNSMQIEGYFLQYCLTTAVQNKSSVRTISLIIQYMTLQFSERIDFYLNLKDLMPLTDIINITVMRCASLDRTVLTPQEHLKETASNILSDLEKVKKFTETLIDTKNDLRSDEEEMEVLEILLETFSTSSVLLHLSACGVTGSLTLSETFGDVEEMIALNLNKSAPLWSQFSDENDMRNKIRSFSPLSLACFMGSSTTLQTLLKNIPKKIHQPKPQEINENVSTEPLKDSLDDFASPGGLKLGFGFEEAVMCAVLSASLECLLILKEHMGAESFSKVCVQSG